MTFRVRYVDRSGARLTAVVQADTVWDAYEQVRLKHDVRKLRGYSIRCEAMVSHGDGIRLGIEPVEHQCYRFSREAFCPVHQARFSRKLHRLTPSGS